MKQSFIVKSKNRRVKIDSRKGGPKVKKVKVFNIIFLSFLLTLAFSNCNVRYFKKSTKETIKVGCKNFTEQYILGEMIAQVIENEDIPVERVFGMSGIRLIHDSITNGGIDIYPEYTGAALMYILNKDELKDSSRVFNIVKDEYKNKFNLIWLEQAPMNNSSVLVVTSKTADKYKIKSFTDAAKKASKLVFCAPAEFWERKDGMKRLIEVYGGFDKFKKNIKMDMGMHYKALVNEEFDVALGNGTDAQINENNLIVLKDNQKVWPPYHPAPVIREEVLVKYPQLENKLNRLFGLLTTDKIIELNLKVDGKDKLEAEDVAKDFLRLHQLIN